MDKKNCKNVFEFCAELVEDGKFSHSVRGEKFYSFKGIIERESKAVDILNFIISEKVLYPTGLVKGLVIKGQGELRSRNVFYKGKSKLVLQIMVKRIIDCVENGNSIDIEGYLCKKPVFRVTPGGRYITDLLIGVNRFFNKSSYIPCIVWGRNACFASKLEVGDKVNIVGRVQSRDYIKKIDEHEEQHTAFEVSASDIELVG